MMHALKHVRSIEPLQLHDKLEQSSGFYNDVIDDAVIIVHKLIRKRNPGRKTLQLP